MSTQFTRRRSAEMRKQLGEFLTRNMGNAGVGWPLYTSPDGSEGVARPADDSLAGLRVLIVGDLALELSVEVAGTRRQLLASLRGESVDDNPRWTPSEPRVGGFAAHAGRAAADLGARVSVCTTVPVPTPAPFERFFNEHSVDRRYLTGLPGACPVTIRVCCQDGRVVVRHRRNPPTVSPDPPRADATGFDAILVDPGHLGDRSSVLERASRCLERGTERLTVALRLDRRSGDDEISVAHDSRVWTFIRYRDARRLAQGIAKRPGQDVGALATCLHDYYGISRLVLQGGPHGAVLMNGLPCPYRVHTCPLAPADDTGAGDTLMAVTALSSASGADDRISIRRGVAAATGQVAGLPLPTSFEELDAA